MTISARIIFGDSRKMVELVPSEAFDSERLRNTTPFPPSNPASITHHREGD